MDRLMRWMCLGAVVLAMAGACGCATPIGVTSLGQGAAYEQIDRCALNSDRVSSYTAVVLHRYSLERPKGKPAVQALMKLHHLACNDNRRDPLFAMAELSFLLGKEGRKYNVNGRVLQPENFFAASAVYAYLFLLGPGEEPPPDSFDRRYRMACDFYNRSLNYVVARREGRGSAGERLWELPVGSMVVYRGQGTDFDLPLSENETFVSADRFRIRGMSVRNRNAGLGAPIVIMGEKKPGQGPMLESSAATVFLRVEGSLHDMTAGQVRCKLDICSAFVRDHVEVNGRSIPLETDLTTHIAYALNDPDHWRLEKLMFRFGQSPFEPGIYPSQPYRPGKIPVLFVHGTMSSPVWWSEMWNTLLGDPVLREKCQFWFYLYDSAKPVAQSAAHLRKCIQDTVGRMDPEGQDAMLRQMVVIGHSQGGLLTKLTATDTGEALIRGATGGKTLAELNLSPKDEELVRRLAIYKPLPEVKRVVFISTPHRGSYQAGGFMRRLVRWVVSLPKDALETTGAMLSLAPKIGPEAKVASTSIDSMAPDNPSMLALAEIPVTTPIKAHSIIAVKGKAVPPAGGDGVVKYTSAHVGGVESELVVRSGHSCQGKAVTIEEVRRILMVHLRATGLVTSPAPTPALVQTPAIPAAVP